MFEFNDLAWKPHHGPSQPNCRRSGQYWQHRHDDDPNGFCKFGIPYARDDFCGRSLSATPASVHDLFTETLSRARPKELAHDYLERDAKVDHHWSPTSSSSNGRRNAIHRLPANPPSQRPTTSTPNNKPPPNAGLHARKTHRRQSRASLGPQPKRLKPPISNLSASATMTAADRKTIFNWRPKGHSDCLLKDSVLNQVNLSPRDSNHIPQGSYTR
jgi:hypothetical protein